MISTPESEFLKTLFNQLNLCNINYAVMRNYESLPFSVNGSDLDILVSKNDENKLRGILFHAIKDSGGRVLGVSETIGFFKVFVLGYNIDLGQQKWWGVRVDINIGLYYKGLQHFSEKFIFPTENFRDIKVLHPHFAAVLGVLKEVLHNYRLPDRYLFDARDAADKNWSNIELALSPMGTVSIGCLKTLLCSDSRVDNQKLLIKGVRKSFLKHILLSKPYVFFKGRALYEWTRVRRFMFPSGSIIALLGVDGAGKSTIIDAIKPMLDNATHKAVHVKHLRPGFLPPLARLKGRSFDINKIETNPHSLKSSGALGSLFRLTYLMLDYFIGFWLLTRLKISKEPAICIFDRYAYDLIIDPRRFRINLPKQLIQLIVKKVPKPDLIFCLYGDPEILADRKKELPLVEVKRQLAEIKEFSVGFPGVIPINTSCPINQSRDKVLEAIFEHCTKEGYEY